VYYIGVLDYTGATHYCTVVSLHTFSCRYTSVVLKIVVHFYTVAATHYYIVVSAQVVLSLIHPAHYMHLMSSP
jgi:hypothetical protein